jgi:hypothetical protein
MLKHLRLWPQWLRIVTLLYFVVWLARALPAILSWGSCVATGGQGQSCGLIGASALVSMVDAFVLLAIAWLPFFLCAYERGRSPAEWKKWLKLGIILGAVTAVIGAFITARLISLSTAAGQAAPLSVFSVAFLLNVVNLFVYGFLLGLLFVFPVDWAIRFTRGWKRPARWAAIGAAIGMPYSILSLVVIPFASVFGSLALGISLQNPLLRLFGYFQPLVFFLIPQTVLQRTPFSPSINPLAGAFEQMLALPSFIFFNAVGDIVLLFLVGWVIGWVVTKVKKQQAVPMPV